MVNNKVHIKDLSKDVAFRCGINKGDAEKIVKATFDSVKQHLYEGITIEITGLGKFYVDILDESLFNLPTKELIWKPKRRKPKFDYSYNFKKEIEEIPIDDDNRI